MQLLPVLRQRHPRAAGFSVFESTLDPTSFLHLTKSGLLRVRIFKGFNRL